MPLARRSPALCLLAPGAREAVTPLLPHRPAVLTFRGVARTRARQHRRLAACSVSGAPELATFGRARVEPGHKGPPTSAAMQSLISPARFQIAAHESRLSG